MWGAHQQRLWKGLQLLKFYLPQHFTPTLLLEETLKLIHQSQLNRARVRINVVRGEGNLFAPVENGLHYIIEATAIEKTFTLNDTGLNLCIYPDVHKICNPISNIKHNNFLPYTLGAIYASEQHCQDSIVLNQFERICDTCIANIFFIKDNEIFTPALSEGCIAGTMRAYIIECLHQLDISINEGAFTINQLLDADAIFVTNALHPIQWVGSIHKNEFRKAEVENIYQSLKKKLLYY